jgi:hypothetical protein
MRSAVAVIVAMSWEAVKIDPVQMAIYPCAYRCLHGGERSFLWQKGGFMKKTAIVVDGVGDSCARSTSAAFARHEQADPEHDFEIELMAALDETEAERDELGASKADA